jgi:hypothetical protein
LVVIPAAFITRTRTHFHALPFADIDVILGLNGYCWVYKRSAIAPENTPAEALYSDDNEDITVEEMQVIARVGNTIKLLARRMVTVNYNVLVEAYEAGLQYEPKQLLEPKVMDAVAEEAIGRMAMNEDE